MVDEKVASVSVVQSFTIIRNIFSGVTASKRLSGKLHADLILHYKHRLYYIFYFLLFYFYFFTSVIYNSHSLEVIQKIKVIIDELGCRANQ